MAAVKMFLRQPAVKFGDVHWHDEFFTPGIYPRNLFIGGGIVDIVDIRHDDAFIFHQVDAVAAAAGRKGLFRSAGGLPAVQRLQLLQHGDDACLMVRFEDVVKSFDLEGFNRMFLVGGNKNNRRAVGEFTDVLRQQHPVQRGNIDIQENGVHLVVLQVFQHVQPIFKGGFNGDTAVLFYQVAQLFLRKEFIFDNNGFHGCSPAVSVCSLLPFLVT